MAIINDFTRDCVTYKWRGPLYRDGRKGRRRQLVGWTASIYVLKYRAITYSQTLMLPLNSTRAQVVAALASTQTANAVNLTKGTFEERITGATGAAQ